MKFGVLRITPLNLATRILLHLTSKDLLCFSQNSARVFNWNSVWYVYFPVTGSVTLKVFKLK